LDNIAIMREINYRA